jgi:hypothetical protein
MLRHGNASAEIPSVVPLKPLLMGVTREHGKDAALEAAQRADAMLEKGRLDGQRVWKRVLAAVKEIQRQEPREGEAVN